MSLGRVSFQMGLWLRERRVLKFCLAVSYSILFQLVWTLLQLLRGALPHALSSQLRNRSLLGKEFAAFTTALQGRQVYIFLCSSAGEYEAALPLMEALEHNTSAVCGIIFISLSGIEFARARKEARPMILAPADCSWNWQKIFSLNKPKGVFLIRYELWPAFLLTANAYAPVFLCNFSAGPSSGYKDVARGFLLAFVDRIFTVTPQDQEKIQQIYAVPATRTVVTGDTKVDRMVRRSLRPLQGISKSDTWKIMILGSAHLADVHRVYPWIKEWLKEHAEVRLVIVPHRIEPAEITAMTAMLGTADYTVCHNLQELGLALDKSPLLILAQMGVLADLYQIGDLAIVGGGFDGQVHNVLEPVVAGCHVAFGPGYDKVAEAGWLVSQGMVTVLESRSDCEKFCTLLTQPRKLNAKMLLDESAGATQKIMGQLTHA